MTEKLPEYKRRNRATSVADALSGALDPVLRKRGFAGRDILTQWRNIVPRPFDETTQPHKLSWPKTANSSEGATLYIRCAPGTALFAQHEAASIAKAVNLYFGYVLVDQVRLSAEPFITNSGPKNDKPFTPSPQSLEKIGKMTEAIEDEALRQSLTTLGLALARRAETKRKL